MRSIIRSYNLPLKHTFYNFKKLFDSKPTIIVELKNSEMLVSEDIANGITIEMRN